MLSFGMIDEDLDMNGGWQSFEDCSCLSLKRSVVRTARFDDVEVVVGRSEVRFLTFVDLVLARTF